MTVAYLGNGTAWPVPDEEMADLEHRLRYGPLLDGDGVIAAGIVSAYMYLVRSSTRDSRAYTVRELKARVRT